MRNARYINRHVQYFIGMQGHEFWAVMRDGVVELRKTFNPAEKHYVFTDREDFVGLVSKAPVTGWSGMVPLPDDKDGVSRTPEALTMEEAIDAVRGAAEEVRAEAEREAADPAYRLEKEMSRHDWTSWASDDYGVAAAGDRHWDLIQSLRNGVEPHVYDMLLAKYKR